jgi:hypothetical protein
MQKPSSTEYNPYFENYINLVGEGDYFSMLEENSTKVIQFFKSIPDALHDYRYAAGKWSIKDILMHIIDTERVMTYRALVAARGDSSVVLPLMDENLYAQNADLSWRTINNLLEEFMIVRMATSHLLFNLAPHQTTFAGNAAGHPITARAVGYIILGHAQHHINVINERYLIAN